MVASGTARAPLWKHAVIGGALLLLTILHFSSPPNLHGLHGLLFKVTFLPLILAGLWFSVRVAVMWAGLTTGAYLIHVFGQLEGHHTTDTWIGDIVLYNVVTLTTAVLSQRRAQALARAETQTRELEANARALLHAEETIRSSDRARALGELAAGMAHEIRNPLGGIRGAAEVLCKEETPDAARAEFGALLDSEVERLDGVVANFLQFAKPPAADTTAVELREVVDAVFLLVGPTARRHDVALAAEIPPGLAVCADAGLLRQLLLNLALNAVQAQPEGGRLRIIGAAGDDGTSARIDVIDAGPGVPDELRERLFDPYVSGREQGSGLGLAVAARLAETMSGTLRLAASTAAGTTIRLTLPAA